MTKRLVEQRNLILEIVLRSGWAGHLSSNMSIIEILNALYFEVMHFEGKGLSGRGSDRFVLGKGHAALALYTTLFYKGQIKHEDLYLYNSRGSSLGGHPCRHKVPGVDVSTGSLGHALPIAVGMAHSYYLQGIKSTVFTLLGDGEMNEGAVWEALLIAEQKLQGNLCAIVDCNADVTKGSNYTPALANKLTAFGWTVHECDGHDINALTKTLKKCKEGFNAVLANTVKGKGYPAMEKEPEIWHYRAVSSDDYIALSRECSI